MSKEYDELRIRIWNVGGGQYFLLANGPSCGSAVIDFRGARDFRGELDRLLHEEFRHTAPSVGPVEERARQLGEELWRLLFPTTIEACFRESQRHLDQRRSLRLRFYLPQELDGTPIELLHEPTGELALKADISIVRSLPAAVPKPVTPVRVPLNIVIASASPQGYAKLDVQTEITNLRSDLTFLTEAGKVNLRVLERATRKRFNDELGKLEGETVVLIIAHGEYDDAGSVVLFEDDSGNPDRVTERILAAMLAKADVRLVAVNSCYGGRSNPKYQYSGIAGKLIGAGVPVVVAFQFQISDVAALIFSKELITKTCCQGYSVDEACRDARVLMAGTSVGTHLEWSTPMLRLREDCHNTVIRGAASVKPGSDTVDGARQMVRDERFSKGWKAALTMAESAKYAYPDDSELLRLSREAWIEAHLVEKLRIACERLSTGKATEASVLVSSLPLNEPQLIAPLADLANVRLDELRQLDALYLKASRIELTGDVAGASEIWRDIARKDPQYKDVQKRLTEPIDAFMSLTAEDRTTVEPLYRILAASGLRVWFGGALRRPELESVLNRCRYVIACLSDGYWADGAAQVHLQANRLRDPVGERGRMIPVLVQKRMDSLVPLELSSRPWVECADPDLASNAAAVIQELIRRPELPVPFASASEVGELQTLLHSDATAYRGALASLSKDVFLFLFQRAVGGTAPDTIQDLVNQLKRADAIPPNLRALAGVLHDEVGLGSYPEGWQDLSRLVDLVAKAYPEARHVVRRDAFEVAWRQWRGRLPGTMWDLAEGRRRVSKVGAFYRVRDARGSFADALLIPCDRDLYGAHVRTQIDECSTLRDGPVFVLDCGFAEAAEGGAWGFVVFGRPEVETFEVSREYLKTLAPTVAEDLLRHIVLAFEKTEKASPAIAFSFFRLGHIRVDDAHTVHLVLPWETGSPRDAISVDPGAFHYCQRAAGLSPSTASGNSLDSWETMKRVLLDLSRNLISEGIEAKLRSAVTPAAFVTEPDADPPSLPASPRVPSGELVRVFRASVECERAWPVGDQMVCTWGADKILSLIRQDGTALWTDAEPVDVRRGALSAAGGLAIGGWRGELRWFDRSGFAGAAGAGWTIGDIRPLNGDWIAGAWNGRLVALLPDGRVRPIQASPDDGVYRLAGLEGASFAALSMQGAVSVYDNSWSRLGHPQMVPGASDIACANGGVAVLTPQGLVSLRGGQLLKPDRLPVRGRARLLASPIDGHCLLLSDTGESWVLDIAGTYPRGPRFPALKGSADVSFKYRPGSWPHSRHGYRCVTPMEQGGFAYFRDGVRLHAWPEALDASISARGHRVAVTLPDAVELYAEDAL